MRFRSLLAACVLPLVATGAVYGCSNSPAPEDFCGWLQNPNSVNCVSHFHKDLKDQCGAADSATVSGTFPTRNMLGMCVLNGKGGSVTFDPPIEIGAPPTGMPMTMHFTNADGTDCGEVAYTSAYSWSLKLVAPVVEGAGGSSATTGTTGGGQSSGSSYSQGMISVTRVGGDTVQVTCPAPDIHSSTELVTPELHTFNLNQVLSSTADNGCPQYAEIIPQAILEIDPGGIGRAGALRLKIQYPPQAIERDAGAASDAGDAGSSGTTATIAPDTTYYFDCVIPAEEKVCANGVQDASEVDVDCGGPESTPNCPVRCEVGQLCVNDCDCNDTFLCIVGTDGTKRCKADTNVPPKVKGVCSQIICANQVKDSSESDVDCGGSCKKCVDGKSCGKNEDCVSNNCDHLICGPTSCTDSSANGNETDVDCGGTCPTKCAEGQKCKVGTDCVSGGCLNDICSACKNGKQDGTETDVDCGGSCSTKCGSGMVCGGDSDCVSASCVSNKCSSCSDNTKNGTETDVDCGGSCPTKCAESKACTKHADCVFNVCVVPQPADAGVQDPGTCNTCADGSKDGTEGDIDCGGTCALKCAVGKTCKVNVDCASGICINKMCK